MMHDSDRTAAEQRLERSVAAALRSIEAAQAERLAPPVRAARRSLGRVYGVVRLAKVIGRSRAAS